jgi:hypothetical protein
LEDINKTKQQLVDDLNELRHRVAEMEKLTAAFGQMNKLIEKSVDGSNGEKEKEILISYLKAATEGIRKLRGLLPICAWCKKVRDDKGYWQQVEKYVEENSNASFTHGICPECMEKIKEEEELV